MDGNFKLSSGYISESVPDLTPIDASISFGGSSSPPKGDFSFDPKLGRNTGNSSSSSAFGNREQVISLSKLKESAFEASRSSSGSSKRTRGNNQIPICLVDGCDSDFSNCREYHKRHKVCHVHSKTPVVTINSYKQRFCQQCSRFHALEEFDEGKRSCRKRLDGHNRRRRKPQPDHIGPPATFFLGSKLLEFCSSPTTSVVSRSWGKGLVAITNGSSYGANSRGKQFPFVQEEEEDSSRMMSCIDDSDCALSLFCLPRLLQPPLSLSQETFFYGSGLFENASAVSDGSANEAVALPQTFPFRWE
ncbi:LOW QUALITY PROTEIN: hypothetical protein N665_0437s0004 [Sinapis alba]|nr:LOW QUALITY PROTEIN: hypothetical protein N665_0437s0004 [Sinapis alba]